MRPILYAAVAGVVVNVVAELPLWAALAVGFVMGVVAVVWDEVFSEKT